MEEGTVASKVWKNIMIGDETNMLKVNFYDTIDDSLLKFAVVVSRFQHQWVFCKHKLRNTYEVPGGHREAEEDILTTAKRELYEETGAIDFSLKPICVYSVVEEKKEIKNQEETFGMLYFAEITAFDTLPDLEMEKIVLFDHMPNDLTYPLIQPILMERVKETVGVFIE